MYLRREKAFSAQNHGFTSSARFTCNQLRDITRSSVTNSRYGWKPATGIRTTYTANGLNQYRTAAGRAVTYDLNGNLTSDGVWTYSYDLDNRMWTATRPGTNAVLGYDLEGRLVRTTIDGAETTLLYDGQALAAEYDKAGALVRRYVFGPGTDEPLVQYEGAGTASKRWMYANQQGCVVALANSSGATTSSQAYGPFGETDGIPASRFGYTGQQYLAPLGLYYYKARMYSPTLGRFLQTDPIGYKDDLNWYAYVGNNPVNLVDPDGNAAVSEIAKAIIKTFKPGPYAGEGVTATGARVTKAEKAELIRQGDPCHICGTKDFGTKTGAPVGDHMKPTSFAGPGEAQRIYPSCLNCSNAQGGILGAMARAKSTAAGVVAAAASTAADAARSIWNDAKNDPMGLVLWPITSTSLGDGTLSGMKKSGSGF